MFSNTRQKLQSNRMKTRNEKVGNNAGAIHIRQTNNGYVEVFLTRMNPGAKIRDAITGAYSNIRVRSKQEYSFFKIAISTGECGNNGNTFFFYGPTDYEQHFHTTLDSSAKFEWNERQVFDEQKDDCLSQDNNTPI